MIKPWPEIFKSLSGKAQVLWLVIILLLVVIVAGGTYFFKQDQGKISTEVTDFSPVDEVQQTTNFTIQFSDDMISDSLINIEPEKAPVEFNPAIPGKFQWISTDKIRFYPDIKLQPSTEYQANVLPRFTTDYGFILKGRRDYHFSTPRFSVKHATLMYEFIPDIRDKAGLIATIEFNYAVEPSEAAKYISIRYQDGEEIPYNLETTLAGSLIQMRAEKVERSKEDKKIQLLIREGLKCMDGNLGLAKDYITPLILPGQNDLKIEMIIPVFTLDDQPFIRLICSLPIQSAGIENFISINPPIDFTISAVSRYVDLQGNFKPDSAYDVTIRQGLKAVDGSCLKKDFFTSIKMEQDLIEPQISFKGNGFFLARRGNMNVGLSTINLENVEVELEYVYQNNLVHLLNAIDDLAQTSDCWYKLDAFGRLIDCFDVTVQNIPNQEIVTPISLEKYIKTGEPGIFRVIAMDKENRWNRVGQWVISTDIGLIVKKSGNDLWIWANSLTSLKPIESAEISLYSQNNQVLQTVKTDYNGIAVIKSYPKIEQDLAPFLIVARNQSDFSFLELTRRLVSTTDFDVSGNPFLINGFEAYLYGERGVYRPGETAHMAVIVRGESISVPVSFPIRFRIEAPDKKIMEEQRSRLNEQGMAEFSLKIPVDAKTGTYAASLLIGENDEIGRTWFSVEEFVPDRIKVALDVNQPDYLAGQEVNLTVTGMTLFGPPAAHYRMEADLEIETIPFSHPRWKSFVFEDLTRSFSSLREKLSEEPLDKDGQAHLTYTIPTNLNPPSALRGIASATVLETGGRGVTSYKTFMIYPYLSYVGLRKLQEGYEVPQQETIMEFVVVNPQGEAVSGHEVEIFFYRMVWQSVLRRDEYSGQYKYCSEEVEELADHFSLTSSNQSQKFKVKPDDYGKFRVYAKDKKSGAGTSIEFYASGWGYAPWAMENPSRIEIDVEKASYQVGEKAKIQIKAPFGGKLLVTVEREKVLYYKILTMSENTAVVEIPIRNEYKPNVYVAAYVIQSIDKSEQDAPIRAFGVAPLQVNTDQHRLKVDLQAPAEIRPNTSLTVGYQVTGHGLKPIYLTIAAVDEGILQLTDFQTPDAHNFFYGKKCLSLDSYDNYSVLLPEIRSLSFSGDADLEARRKKHLSPISIQRIKPIAFWSGLLQVNQLGIGKISMNLPQFNGTLRLMATAVENENFGLSEKKIIVRDPIIIRPTFPRFLSSGDVWYLPVNLYNSTGSGGEFSVTLKTQGPIALLDQNIQHVYLNDKQEKSLSFKLKAENSTGTITLTLQCKGNGEKTQIEETLPLRSPVPFTTLTGSGSLTEKQSADFSLPADWVEGAVDFSLTVSALPGIRFSRSLQYLLQYPHGCLEQTTSRLFPLLYFDEIARLAEPELFQKNGADYFLEEGIKKLESMQLTSGAFSFWSGGDYVNNWGCVYASHFLVEARKAGHIVSDRVYSRMLDALRQYTLNFPIWEHHALETAVYAVYVLALAREPERSAMLYMKNSLKDQMADYSLFQLAGAFAASGDGTTAMSMIPGSITPDHTQKSESGGNFNSSVRSQAIILDVLSQINPGHPGVPVLVKNLTQAADRNGHWGNTQENAWAFLALSKILQKHGNPDFTGKITLSTQPYGDFDFKGKTFQAKDWAGKSVRLSISGQGTCYYQWTAEGIPSTLQVDDYDHDLVIRRRYLNENGAAVSYQQFTQGELVIAEITIQPLFENLDQVAVIDMIPAGFEIENSRLQSRKAITWMGEDVYNPDYLDIRDDRLILFGDFQQGKNVKFYYGLRAVTIGQFILPPIRGEAMYMPAKASVSSGGRIIIR